MLALSEFDLPKLQSQLVDWGFLPAHARRLLREFYQTAGQFDLDDLQIGKALCARLRGEVAIVPSRIISRHRSADGTIKLLMKLDRGGTVETVLMPAYRPDRAAGCVSSQIGCAMGCDFCASARGGLVRNLTSGEIVEQFLHLKREAESQDRHLSSLVFMGMGEPMHNLQNVIAAIRRIAQPPLGNLGFRAITVSTVGIVPGIEELADRDLGVHLAVSLHAPDDETRARIVPTARRWRIADIIAAAKRFAAKTDRYVTIEYCLLAGVNDSDAQAIELARLLEGFAAHVNLIPYNAIGAGLSGAIYAKPETDRMQRFMQILREHRVVAHFRRTRGDDVSAACGQLRSRLILADDQREWSSTGPQMMTKTC
jgi:23S rRNA (adenine2503-C2)-methyltransferase